MGLAPKEADIVDSIPPSYFGDNMDNWRVGKGATMYYPIAVPGGFVLGRRFACRTGRFRIVRRRYRKDEWVLHGFSFANYLEELHEA